MKFFYVENLTQQSAHSDVAPWDYKAPAEIPAQIRRDKQSRQEWYRSANTRHYFYSFIEGANPNQRVSKESNPPAFIHGFGVDYDTPIHDETLKRVFAEDMPIKPTWVETSLGGCRHLIWILERPIPVGDTDFCAYVLQAAVKWLRLNALPLLDEPNFVNPVMTLCNGLIWEKTGEPIRENVSQAFFVECGRSYNYKSKDVVTIPLSIIEKELRARYPKMDSWPDSFDYESVGPSFWVEGSQSVKSAIVKKDGIFTFAGHAAKPFYSWTDLLGADFVRQFATEQMGSATKGIYWDSKSFWKYNPSLKCISPEDKDSLVTYLKVNMLISTKPDKDGTSQMDKALDHIRQYNRIKCAAPVLFRPPGLLNIGGDVVLNTLLDSHVLQPAAEPAVWGPEGNFPFISYVLDNLFEPHSQLRHFNSWLKHAYCNALVGNPMSGQASFLCGGPGMGKTLLSTKIVAGLFRGYANGAKYVTGQDQFGGEIFSKGVICVDDETVSSSDNQRTKMEAIVKQLVANPIQRVRIMYQMPMLTEWMGRLMVSCNLDPVSLRMLPSLSDGMKEKVNYYRVAEMKNRPGFSFPPQDVVARKIDAELPYFARFLVDFVIPQEFLFEARFGIRAHHDPTLKETAHQSTKTATFYELLLMSLNQFFIDNPNAKDYKATTTQLHRLIIQNPYNQEILRTMRVEQVGRYLEQVQREGLLPCYTATVAGGLRAWVFPRFESLDLTLCPNEQQFNRPPTP